MTSDSSRQSTSLINGALASVFLLLSSVALLMLGVGLQNTLLGVRAGLEHFSNIAIGVVMACYFSGFVAGSILSPHVIDRVGHIRTFSALATVISAAAVLHVVAIDLIAWGLFRFLTGFCVAGLYLVVESWLNGRATNRDRGQILSAYFFVNLGAVAAGQQIMRMDDPHGFELFVYASVLVSLAILPVALTRAEAPAPPRASAFRLRSLLRVSPFALFGAAAAGLANGAFWGLAPLYGVQIGVDSDAIALGMTVAILGGAVLQLPLGRLSDFYDRRAVMGAANAGLAVIALAIAFTEPDLGPLGLGVAFLFGGLLLTQYSLCVAHANDYVVDGDFVQLASALLLVFGSAAALGPVAGAALMDAAGPQALFAFIVAAAAACALYAAWRMTRRSAPTMEEGSDFAPVAAALGGAVLAPTEDAYEGIDEVGEEFTLIEEEAAEPEPSAPDDSSDADLDAESQGGAKP